MHYYITLHYYGILQLALYTAESLQCWPARCKSQCSRCKGQDQHQRKQSGMQQQHAIPTTTTTHQLRISISTGGVHHAAILATCIRAGHGRNLNCLPLCKLQCAAVLTLSWSLVVVVGAACCCCIPLWLVLYAGPDLCTLCLRLLSQAALYGGCVSPSAFATDAPLAHVVVSLIATCAGGVFPSTHWRRYCTCARASCTAWWWSK